MPKPLSQDLRLRIVAMYDEGHTVDDVADAFRVGDNTVRRYVELRDSTGSLAPKGHGGGAPKALDEEQRRLLRRCQEKWPDKTIKDLLALFSRAARKQVSQATIKRELRAMGYTRKKNPQGKRTKSFRRAPGP